MRTAVFVNFLILIVAAFALAQVTPEEAVAPAAESPLRRRSLRNQSLRRFQRERQWPQ